MTITTIPTRVGADEIMRTLKRVDGSGDPEWLDQLAANVRNEPSWELRKIRLAQLDTGETRNPDVIAEYAAMSKESRPPSLVLRDGTVVDGGHRAQAAMHNREKTVLAYVPVGSMLDPIPVSLPE